MHPILYFLIKAKNVIYKTMAENKTTKKIYINASKVSHFTNFNRFTKENENIEILYEHNLWLRNFFILHIKIQFQKL